MQQQREPEPLPGCVSGPKHLRITSIPAMATAELRRCGDAWPIGDSGERLGSGRPRWRITEEPEAVRTKKPSPPPRAG